jgi:hypothetical protein
MHKILPIFSRGSRPPTTLSGGCSMRMGVTPPSLRNAPAASESPWQRLLFWLLAPAPQQSLPLSKLPKIQAEFMATVADIDNAAAERLRERLGDARSLRELWHARAEIYRVVGLAHTQQEAERRVALLDRHFPTRAARSQFAFT